MEFNISAQHTTLTPALEQYVREKFTRLQDHVDRPVQAHVILRVDSGRHEVEAVITGLGKSSLVAKCNHKDMYAAINDASHTIDRQWRKQKTAELSKRGHETIRRVSP